MEDDDGDIAVKGYNADKDLEKVFVRVPLGKGMGI